MTALTLPRLAGVQTKYRPRDDSAAWSTPTLLGLLDGGALSAGDAIPRPSTPTELLHRTLQRHWDEITAGARIFDWHLVVCPAQDSQSHPRYDILQVSISSSDGGNRDAPQYFLGPAMQRLENILPGLGQTVLAVFYDALALLPNTLTPRTSLGHASWVHWGGMKDETDAIQQTYDDGEFETLKQAAEAYHGPTHAEIFAHMPTWAVDPIRVLTQRQVRAAARADKFAGNVAHAVDAVWNHVHATHAASGYADCGVTSPDGDSITWLAIFRWSQDDLALRLADDFVNQAIQAEYTDAATIHRFTNNSDQTAVWLQRMRANGELARLVEHLIALIAAPNVLRQRVRTH
ncbi:PRTRC system protein F [Ralstonia sp. SM1864_UCD524_TZ4]|nr:PRTRC system protein F [Ralstonia pseudosolanacearum]CUV23513.1 conserved protein of unknown function [Ralstonia solanacearum]CUV42735.1 conserved protein of unknown function [Ralstonia solanacearum]CUV62199.1 conserved protein of unknown function [Ralstonia solanacearum]